MDPELAKRLDEQDKKLDAIYKSVEKTRRYFLIITWITVIAIVLPLIGLLFAVPSFMKNYVDPLSSMSGMSGF